MSKSMRYNRILHAINRYIVVFLLVSFIVSCCTMLFMSIISVSLELTFTEENVTTAAKLTFANVILLSLFLTAIDAIRRKITVDRPVKKITEAAGRMMEGDFSVRIPKSVSLGGDDKFGEIIDCINKMAEELSGVETLRTDFISNVSHELKTPLSIMQNYGTMLQSPDLSDEQRAEYAKAITDASRRLATLITNILRLNKLENQQITENAHDYNLGEQLCECLLGFEDVWEQKGIAIETDLEENVTVNADAEMLSLVWNNLFSNAFKFTEKGGTVSLSLKTAGEYAVVEICDTGCGIPADIGNHIFDKFYQGDTSHSSEGNGLGLALVKRVIDITGSDISIKSEVGNGTSFTVKIRRNPV